MKSKAATWNDYISGRSLFECQKRARRKRMKNIEIAVSKHKESENDKTVSCASDEQ